MLKIFYQLVRFAGIGFLNTAVDFAVLNLFASLLGAYTGTAVGVVNVVSFTLAVAHSYYWNKYWAFGSHQQDGRFVQNLGQFVAAAVVGVVVIAAAIFGAGQAFGIGYYLLLLVLLGVGEVALWKIFHLQKDPQAKKSGKELLAFVIVSIIGALINSGILAVGTSVIAPQFGLSQELWTNLIKAGATVISLMWNFLGYKLIVFKQ